MKEFPQLLKFLVVMFLISFLTACGPAVRTADGDCYYRGKGALSFGAILLDATSAYVDTAQEQQYQRDQISLQQLSDKFNATNTYTLQSDDEIRAYNNSVDEYNRLLKRVEKYKEEKQKRIKDSPTDSFSKQVDESGEC